MKTFTASEWKTNHPDDIGAPTGHVETYLAESAEAAAQSLLYTRRLSYAGWEMGPTNRVVRLGNTSWVITPEKQHAVV